MRVGAVKRDRKLVSISRLPHFRLRLGAYTVMEALHVATAACGSPAHLTDLAALRARQLPIPHDYSSWPLYSTIGDWAWCRVVDAQGDLITGFTVHLTSSWAVPGTRIGRIDRVGRELHAMIAEELGAVLKLAAREIPRLLRLDVRIFDENAARRQKLCGSLAAAGWAQADELQQYGHTLVLNLGPTYEDVLRSLSTRARRTTKAALDSPALHFSPIVGETYVDRFRHLHALSFARTGAMPPPIDVEGILHDSSRSGESLLVGAFARGVPAPQDLVALLWGRLHGDHAVLEVNASERSALFRRLSPGFGLMSEFIRWAIQHRAQWIDLGGVSCLHPLPADPMRGVIEFKSRFSGDLREIAAEWQLAPQPLLTALAQATRTIARVFRNGVHVAQQQ